MILMISRLVARLVTILLAIYWVTLTLGTHLPAAKVPSIHVYDKTAHFVGYAGLAFLLATAVTVYRLPTRRTYAWMAVILLLYGAIDELAQIPIPGRTADFWDWTADAIGLAIGLVLHRIGLILFDYLSTRTIAKGQVGR